MKKFNFNIDKEDISINWNYHTKAIGIDLRISCWMIGKFHDYYDGNHTTYKFGPFFYYKWH